MILLLYIFECSPSADPANQENRALNKVKPILLQSD